jgi:hypothetical protein
MPLLSELKPLEERYPENYPPIEYYISESSLKSSVVKGLRELIQLNTGERELDKYISKHPVLLTALLNFKNTGNHAAWVVPKKSIRSKVSSDVPGLIPDFIVGGKNSYGITWYVVELKGANHSLFKKSGGSYYLSSEANRGLCQVLEYMNFCNFSQSNLRDTLKLHDFAYANGFIFIGRENETNDQRAKELKSAFNNLNDKLEIRSYDALLRCCESIIDLSQSKSQSDGL